MKRLLKVQSLLILAAALGLGLVITYFLIFAGPVPFKELPGLYQCEGFGLPDAEYSKLRVTPEMQLIGISPLGEFHGGRLAPKDDGAELEYSMEVVHHPTYKLDPFTAPIIKGYGKSMTFRAKKGGETFTATCHRLEE